MSNILVIAAHPDDEILGPGGTIAKHAMNGDDVYCLILGEGQTSRYENREMADLAEVDNLHTDSKKAASKVGYVDIYFSNLPDNRFDSVALLDVIKVIEKYIDKIEPEIVYTHHYGDLNIDHRVTFEAVLTACRPISGNCVKEIYCFETPSSTEWNFAYGDNTFKPNVFINIEKTLAAKLAALQCYESEIREFPHPRSIKALEVIAAKWGSVAGVNYAEAFELIRKVE